MDAVCHYFTKAQPWKTCASIQGNHDNHQTATSGVTMRSTLRQSMPSRNIESCARLRCTVPLSAARPDRRPRSGSYANRHRPSPSHQISITISPLRPRNTNTCPKRLLVQHVLHLRTQLDHRIRGADPSLLLQSDLGRGEAGSLAKALEDRPHQR